ncbi:helix-turn-helix domain-containing protein [Paenibacillus mucilaginosus]|uniref:Cytoskeleton protein RodZ-like C-terminal domain-containing protein n=3 Tax=Paenibacillus mucilaginosus TaxID=61624 RepID=H6NPA1_9BACL|nr:helix-turn-helix domain-containing protein [Paenibacillus mucilaginosus]AEI44268.1 hypothetical protein KNP414_05744 [Paenibacillus mucilaginosus KNP414]AFC31811.1 hypothetical protein PM3016_5085 [Paenibacillus mucilaginosus 3016]AFH64166.1 hypothetical protein B2K_26340 [Paenibacillus mucilaginosus K02]MCG7216676.1 DUF4115 domain-containing protein [Paenibacillus mucilaginosus]WDM25669.1 helix-turn-helix domain-containing protein [Paenibacillus mucilaginosus]
MSELGQLLKKARLDKKISLEDLQETTKIRKRYLEAIEDGNYKVLPGNFYVRAFIKSYAEAVGLEPNEVLSMYQSDIPAAEPEHIEPIRSKRTSRNSERFSKWASSAMLISFVVLIFGLGYYFVSKNYEGTSGASEDLPARITDDAAPPPAAPQPGTENGNVTQNAAGAVPAPAPAPTPAPNPAPTPASAAEVKLAKSERGTDFYTVTGTDKLSIQITIKGDACWLEVDQLQGGKRTTVDQGTYKNGETKTYELTTSGFLIFGKASAVDLVVNGTPVAVGDVANVKKIQLDFAQASAATP